MRERDALARSLRKEGRRDEADEVRKLEKPTVVAALVNRLAREKRREVGQLLRAAGALREAQVSGKGDFAEAAAAERDSVQVLTRAARDLDEDASVATLDRVSMTLRAAAADDEARALLERGVLTREVEASGFGSLLSALPAESKPSRRTKPRTRPTEDPALRRERAKAEKEVERAQVRVEHTAEKAAEAQEAARAAAEELAAAERRLGNLRQG